MSGPSVLIDMRPLQGPSAKRGVGSYASGILHGLIEEGFDRNLTLLLDSDLPVPPLPVGEYRLASSRRRYRGQLAAYEEAVVLGSDLARIHPDLYHAIDLKLPGRSPVPLVVTVPDGRRTRYDVVLFDCAGEQDKYKQYMTLAFRLQLRGISQGMLSGKVIDERAKMRGRIAVAMPLERFHRRLKGLDRVRCDERSLHALHRRARGDGTIDHRFRIWLAVRNALSGRPPGSFHGSGPGSLGHKQGESEPGSWRLFRTVAKGRELVKAARFPMLCLSVV